MKYLIIIVLTPISLLAQVPNKSFNYNSHEVNTTIVNSNLVSKSANSLSSSFTVGFAIGYGYLFNFKKWYSLGFGAQLGGQKYNLYPTAPEFSQNVSDNRIIIIQFPITINRFFPLNKKYGLLMCTGLNLSKTISSLANFGSIVLLERDLYDTTASINPLPQLGFIFNVKLTYAFKSNNYFSYGVIAKKNLNHAITVNYNYYSNSNPTITGELISSEFFIGVNLAYHFKSFINE